MKTKKENPVLLLLKWAEKSDRKAAEKKRAAQPDTGGKPKGI